MIVEPAHRALDDIVEHLEAGLDRNIDAPPDRRISIGKRDVQAGDNLRHAAMLNGTTSAVQFQCMSSTQRDRPSTGDLLDYIGDIGLWLDAMELGGLNHRMDRGSTLTARLRADNQPVLPADGNAAYRTFGDIVFDLGHALVEERVRAVQRLRP